jgi:hypothetical protein
LPAIIPVSVSPKIDRLVKVGIHLFQSFRCRPESGLFRELSRIWALAFTGVTTLYEAVKLGRKKIYHLKTKNERHKCDFGVRSLNLTKGMEVQRFRVQG